MFLNLVEKRLILSPMIHVGEAGRALRVNQSSERDRG